MADKNNTISSVQFMTMIISSQIGFSMVTLPSQIAKKAGHDGWICILAAGLFSILCSWLIILLMQRYGDKSIYEITRFLFGKIFGTLFNGVIILYLTLTAALTVRILGNFVSITIMPNTPPFILTVFLLSPSIYIAWYGLKPLARLNSNIYLILIITVLYLLATYKQLRLSFLLPVAESGFLPILRGTPQAFFGFVGLELAMVYYPNVADKDRVLKFDVYGNVISIVFFSLVVIAATALFGENLLKILVLPMFTLAGTINAPVLERIDLYFSVMWFIAAANSLRGYLFAGYYSLGRAFNLTKRKRYLLAYTAVVLLLSRFPKDINGVFKFSTVINYFAAGIIAFLLICLFLSLIRKKGVKKQCIE